MTAVLHSDRDRDRDRDRMRPRATACNVCPNVQMFAVSPRSLPPAPSRSTPSRQPRPVVVVVVEQPQQDAPSHAHYWSLTLTPQSPTLIQLVHSPQNSVPVPTGSNETPVNRYEELHSRGYLCSCGHCLCPGEPGSFVPAVVNRVNDAHRSHSSLTLALISDLIQDTASSSSSSAVSI